MRPPIVHVFDDDARLATAAADAIAFTAAEAVAARGRFDWALAGGGTPRRTYGELAAYGERFPWDRSEAWLGDERVTPADDPSSNARMAREQLFAAAGIDPAPLQTFDTSIDPHAAARDYAGRLAERLPEPPVLDLVLLGLGDDAHTASWFPGSCFDDDAWVAATDEAFAGFRRLTLTPAAVNAARRVLFLVSGAAKLDALERVFDGPRDPENVPAQRVAPGSGQVMWMIDREAAGHSLFD